MFRAYWATRVALSQYSFWLFLSNTWLHCTWTWKWSCLETERVVFPFHPSKVRCIRVFQSPFFPHTYCTRIPLVFLWCPWYSRYSGLWTNSLMRSFSQVFDASRWSWHVQTRHWTDSQKKHVWAELRSNPVIRQRIISPMTTCPIHLFSKSVSFVITMFEGADLRLHRFEDRLNFPRHQLLGGAFEVPFSLRCGILLPTYTNSWMFTRQLGWRGTCEAMALTHQIFECYPNKLVSGTCLLTLSYGLWINVGFCDTSCFNATDFSIPDNKRMSFSECCVFCTWFCESTLFASRRESHPARFCMKLIELDDELNEWWLSAHKLRTGLCLAVALSVIRVRHLGVFLYRWKTPKNGGKSAFVVSSKRTVVWGASIFLKWKNLWLVCQRIAERCSHIWCGF